MSVYPLNLPQNELTTHLQKGHQKCFCQPSMLNTTVFTRERRDNMQEKGTQKKKTSKGPRKPDVQLPCTRAKRCDFRPYVLCFRPGGEHQKPARFEWQNNGPELYNQG